MDFTPIFFKIPKSIDLLEPVYGLIYSKRVIWPLLSKISFILRIKSFLNWKIIFLKNYFYALVLRFWTPPCGGRHTLLLNLTETSSRGSISSILSPLLWSHLVDLDDYGYLYCWLLSSIYKSSLIRLYRASYESNKIINALRPDYQNIIRSSIYLNFHLSGKTWTIKNFLKNKIKFKKW